MRAEESVDAVFDCLDRSSELDVARGVSDNIDPDVRFIRPVAIGLDTNAVKHVRRDSLLASDLVETADAFDVPIIVPGQVVIEFWNNHRVFARGADSLSRDLDALNNTARRLDDQTTDPSLKANLATVRDALRNFIDASTEARDPELYDRSAVIWSELSRVASFPFVPRSRFRELGEVRFASRTPPGFEDRDKYPSHLGDFFVWADFLLGLHSSLTPESGRRPDGRVVFVTDDAKIDWMTSGRPHPVLGAEVRSLTGLPLTVAPSKALTDLLSAIREAPTPSTWEESSEG